VLVEAISGAQRVELYEDAVLVLRSVDPTPWAPIKTPIHAYIKADQGPKTPRWPILRVCSLLKHNYMGGCHSDWSAKQLRPHATVRSSGEEAKLGTWRCASRACGGRRHRRSGRSPRRSCGWARPARTPAASSLPTKHAARANVRGD
jgi:hypothetical protein